MRWWSRGRLLGALIALIALIALGASPLVAQAPRTFAGACTRADELDLQTVHPAPDSAPVFVGPAPRTPRFALRDGYRGRVLVAVIVDSLGRAEHEGAAIVGATDQGLRDWACDFVRQMRFAPARHAGGTVRAQAVVPFEFSARVVRRR